MNKSYKDLPIVDWGQEDHLAHNASGLTNELLVMFAEQMPETQKAINLAFTNKDYQELSSLLHKLQGGCVYCGLLRLKAIIIEINRAIREQKVIEQEMMDQINQEMEAVMGELRNKGIVS